MEMWYEVFGLNPGVSSDTVKKKYRELANMYHPDVNSSPNAQAMFTKVAKAYKQYQNSQVRKPTPTSNFSVQKCTSIVVPLGQGVIEVEVEVYKTENTECSTCNKTGKIITTVTRNNVSRDVVKQCTVCKGTGLQTRTNLVKEVISVDTSVSTTIIDKGNMNIRGYKRGDIIVK